MKRLQKEIERDHESWPMQLTFIEADDYTQLFKGIKQRVIHSHDDVKYDFERKFQKYFKSLNFKDFRVILLKFKAGAYINEHFHTKDEIIHCLQGSVKIHDIIHESKSIVKIPALQVHDLTCLTNGLLLITIKK